MTIEKQKVVAEISIIPLGRNYSPDTIQASISKEISVAFDSIQ